MANTGSLVRGCNWFDQKAALYGGSLAIGLLGLGLFRMEKKPGQKSRLVYAQC